MGVPEIPVAEFRKRCLSLIAEVQREGQEVIITDMGVPVARLVPANEPKSLLGSVLWERDLISPIDEPWDADRRAEPS